MGYRSDIQFTCLKRDYDALVAAYQRIYDGDYPLLGPDKVPEILENIDAPLGQRDDVANAPENATIHFGWTGIKWYDGDLDDITAFEQAFDEVFDDDNKHPYTRVRIGEDFEDVDHDYCDPNDVLSTHLGPSVTIEMW